MRYASPVREEPSVDYRYELDLPEGPFDALFSGLGPNLGWPVYIEVSRGSILRTNLSVSEAPV